MGPDEFQMMVNHNTYTNYMDKMTLEITLKALRDFDKSDKVKYHACVPKTDLYAAKTARFSEAMEKTVLLYDPSTKPMEHHQGYFDLTDTDVDPIPVTDIPPNSHGSYDRISHNDMIK